MAALTNPIGIVGLGLVGQALTTRLRTAGYDVRGFDINASVRVQFEALGGIWCPSLDETSICPIIIMAVMTTADVESVLYGEAARRGLVEGSSARRLQCDAEPRGDGGAGRVGTAFVPTALEEKPKLIIDCSTGNPTQLEYLAKRLKSDHIDFLEAPLSGASEQIAKGEATLLLGGEPSVIAANKPLLNTLSPKQIHIGPVGMGARAKLATNLVLGLNRAALAEGMVFAQSQGIAPAQFLDLVLATPARSEAAIVKGRKMAERDFTPQSRIRQHLKDLELMLAAALERDQALPLTERHAALLRGAVDAGDGELDNAALINHLERLRASH